MGVWDVLLFNISSAALDRSRGAQRHLVVVGAGRDVLRTALVVVELSDAMKAP